MSVKLSCCAYSFRQYLQSGQMTLEQFVRKCADIGLDGVELTAYYFPTTDEAYLHRLKRFVFLQGLDISGTAVGNNFCQPSPEVRKQQIALVRQWIDISAALGSPVLRVFAGPVPQGHTEEEAREWTIEALKECAEYAQARGVMLALENHGGITDTAEKTISLIKSVASDWVGANLDFGNYHENPYEEIAATAPYAITTHAKTHTEGPNGREELDYTRIAQIMFENDYKGYISIEYEEREDPMSAIPRFVEKLRSAFG
ncbi:MAG: sugar phosphate isomerase/epimerase family protein [Armatimonadota bacterium]